MSRPRVDDYFPFGCGDIVREKGGRHTGRVEAVVSNEVRVKWHGSGWRSAFTASGGDWQIEKLFRRPNTAVGLPGECFNALLWGSNQDEEWVPAPTGRDFLRAHGLPIVEGDPINDMPL